MINVIIVTLNAVCVNGFSRTCPLTPSNATHLQQLVVLTEVVSRLTPVQ